MRSFAFLITASVMAVLFMSVVLASVTLTAVKDATPERHASLVQK